MCLCLASVPHPTTVTWGQRDCSWCWAKWTTGGETDRAVEQHHWLQQHLEEDGLASVEERCLPTARTDTTVSGLCWVTCFSIKHTPVQTLFALMSTGVWVHVENDSWSIDVIIMKSPYVCLVIVLRMVSEWAESTEEWGRPAWRWTVRRQTHRVSLENKILKSLI